MHRVLIVDDEVVVTMQLEERLTSMGYEVVGRASSGKASINMAKRFKPDIILMDIVMPGKLDGIDAAEIIKTELDIPAIFLTAYTDDEFVERAREVEPFGYIVKPYQEREIMAAIEIALHKKDIEQRLRESEERYRSVIDTAREAIITVDSRGNIVSWNHAAYTMFGYLANESTGKPFTFIMPEQLRKDLEDEMNHIVSTGKSNTMGKTVVYSGLRKDGSEFPMEFSLTTWKTNKGIFFTIILRDITERKLAVREIEESRNQLRSLSARLQSAREEERKEIAREIHDELGQDLTTLRMNLSWLKSKLRKDQKLLQEEFAAMTELTDSMIQAVKKIFTQLRPPLLDQLGVIAALEWETREFKERTRIGCNLTVDPEEIDLDLDRATAVCRIFKASLTNIARHAQATAVKASLKVDSGQLVMEISDNGIGITEEQIASPQSFGLMSIRERVLHWGGETIITGNTGEGTTIAVIIPLDDGASHDDLNSNSGGTLSEKDRPPRS